MEEVEVVSLKAIYVNSTPRGIAEMGCALDTSLKHLTVANVGSKTAYIGVNGVTAGNPSDGVAGDLQVAPGDTLFDLPVRYMTANKLKFATSGADTTILNVIQSGD